MSKICAQIFSAASVAQRYLSFLDIPIAVTYRHPLASFFLHIYSAVSAFQINMSGFYPF